MDFSWLIIFIVISIASTLLSKRKERQEQERRAREREQGTKPATDASSKTAPPAGPPPVAPGPFGPLWKPEPPKRVPEPVPEPMAAEEMEPEELEPVPAAPALPARPLFREMQRELDEREAKKAARDADSPRTGRAPVVVPAFPPKRVEHAFQAQDGESSSRRVVEDAAVAVPDDHRSRSAVARWGSLRTAVVMAEVLKKPLALRSEGDGDGVF